MIDFKIMGQILDKASLEVVYLQLSKKKQLNEIITFSL